MAVLQVVLMWHTARHISPPPSVQRGVLLSARRHGRSSADGGGSSGSKLAVSAPDIVGNVLSFCGSGTVAGTSRVSSYSNEQASS